MSRKIISVQLPEPLEICGVVAGDAERTLDNVCINV